MSRPLLHRLSQILSIAILATGLMAPTPSWSREGRDAREDREETVSQRLGGMEGIFTFLEQKVVPALLADPVVAPFFNGQKFTLTESPRQISTCLALFLDSELGGPSPKSGAVVSDPASPDPAHRCRSSMSKIHKTMNLDDTTFDRFIEIVAAQARIAGIAEADIEAVGEVLDDRRGPIVRR